ncbi:MAG: VanZ family protein [Anaerolineae bacterium]|nr:VanZ family protein [Anaerolineae bacterium]
MSSYHLAGQAAESPVIRWSAALSWSVLATYLMTWPSQGTPVGSLSVFFGGSELTDAIGHVVLCGVLVGLWYWALRGSMEFAVALGIAVAIGLVLGVVTEVAQIFVPSRGASLLDLLANMLGIGLAVGAVMISDAK